MDKATKILDKYFGYSSFREGQHEIISNILRGRDVMCIMPTGAGKSVCYQIPALIFNGITLVISPLISLMKDQVDSMNDIGINSDYINSTRSLDEIEKILMNCYDGEIKVLYIAPERLENEKFNRRLRDMFISQVAVDEAHCVSMWGHDFRKSYRSISKFINTLNIRPIVTAFTATATYEVREDILKFLELKNPYSYVGSFDRENLEVFVHKEEDKLEFTKDYIKEHEQEAGIIYCATRKEVDALYVYLKDIGLNVGKYHAGLKSEEKNYYQDEFLKDNLNAIIATNAFGMGIDKSNVRYIIHFSLCKNIENYYQEIGRSGRDGEKATCHLLYNRADIKTLEYMINATTKDDRKVIEIRKLQNMIDFCEYDKCYRSFILNYFGDKNKNEYCNSCSNCLKDDTLRDFTIEAQMILACVYRTREMYGISVLVDILKGIKGPKIIENKLDSIKTYSIMKDYSSRFIRDLIKTLLDLGYVNLKEGTYSMLKLNAKSIRVLKSKERVICKLSEDVSEAILDKELFNKLKLWRKYKSNVLNIRPYIILSDSSLIEIVNSKPKDYNELLNIRGMGEKKLKMYGDEILKIINN